VVDVRVLLVVVAEVRVWEVDVWLLVYDVVDDVVVVAVVVDVVVDEVCVLLVNEAEVVVSEVDV
jgi:hypothetical protein